MKTTWELMTFFEEFYGEKYSGVLWDTMMAYLSDRSPDFYKATASVLVKRFSRTFGKVPGPAEIELHMKEIIDAIPKPKFIPDNRPEISEGERETGLKILDELLARFKTKTARR